jgi:hypothetical protein
MPFLSFLLFLSCALWQRLASGGVVQRVGDERDGGEKSLCVRGRECGKDTDVERRKSAARLRGKGREGAREGICDFCEALNPSK